MPDRLDRCILILLLRSAGCSHDAAASIVRCHKALVGKVERWFIELPWVEALVVCEDQAIKRIVGRELPSLEEVSQEVLIKAAQITGRDMLRCFRNDYVEWSVQEGPQQEKPNRHQELMLEIAGRWKDELGIRLWRDFVRHLGEPGTHYGEHGVVWQVIRGGEPRLSYPLEVATDMESTLLFSYLKEHLETSGRSWFFQELAKWKETGSTELSLRSQLLRRIDQIAEETTGARTVDCERRIDLGLCYRFGDTILAIVVDHVYRKLTYRPISQAEDGLYWAQYGAW